MTSVHATALQPGVRSRLCHKKKKNPQKQTNKKVYPNETVTYEAFIASGSEPECRLSSQNAWLDIATTL